MVNLVCREDLLLTTFKEFFDVIANSFKKEKSFHEDILDPAYKYIGICLDFGYQSNNAQMKILLAKEKGDNLNPFYLDSKGNKELDLEHNNYSMHYHSNELVRKGSNVESAGNGRRVEVQGSEEILNSAGGPVDIEALNTDK